MDLNTIKEFPVTIYGNLEEYTPVLSKARCRIFYKYENRNGTYITDEFAEKLINSLPYTPVKGIYDNFEEDYTDHGVNRNLGRIYGIVPENPNFQWENHKDEDGIERTYACTDVFIFSALYEEASQIIGKSQSMELYQPSIKGDWAIINGKRLFKFEDGCFLGLQVLGNEVEPCFEGAAFFSLYSELKTMIKQIEQYSLNFQKEGGKSEMTKLNFKLSDSQKHDAIWSLLNESYNEENNWTISYAICDIFEDYALAFNYETGSYERVYYKKDDSSDSIELGQRKKCYILDVTESEKNALESLRAFNGGTYEKIDEVASKLKDNNEKFSLKIGELEEQVSTLTTERDTNMQNYENAQNTISTLTEDLEKLKEYKVNVELQEKEQVIESYADILGEEILSEYKNKISEYKDALTLDKELAYELKRSNPSVFTRTPQYVPKDESKSGIEEILAKYKK
jgi:hypothetical protein